MPKKLWSIFTDDMEHCIETGTNQVHRHHIFRGSRRKLSEKYGFVIPIAYYLHEFGKDSIHENPNKGLDLKYKQLAQTYYEISSWKQTRFHKGIRQVLAIVTRKPFMANNISHIKSHCTERREH